MNFQNVSNVGDDGHFVRELRRLIAGSRRDATEAFSAAQISITVLDSSRSDVERVGWRKWKKLASELGVSPGDLLRPMLVEFDPWLVPLLDELTGAPNAGARTEHGKLPHSCGSGA